MDVVAKLNYKYGKKIFDEIEGNTPRMKYVGIEALLDEYFIVRLKQLMDHADKYGTGRHFREDELSHIKLALLARIDRMADSRIGQPIVCDLRRMVASITNELERDYALRDG